MPTSQHEVARSYDSAGLIVHSPTAHAVASVPVFELWQMPVMLRCAQLPRKLLNVAWIQDATFLVGVVVSQATCLFCLHEMHATLQAQLSKHE